ncbi:MAG: hypothetical protein HFE66_08410 [Clostridiales bacterium]|jgi:uncharacterized protein YjdB|nr:hypothetical protein [Clostridiales bacterium]
MASGYFEGVGDHKLYCVWDSKADNEKNTSDVALTVYCRYRINTGMMAGEITVDLAEFGEPNTVKTEAFYDNFGGSSGTKNKYLTRWVWKGIPHKPDGTRTVKLSAVWLVGSDKITAEEEVVLDPIPQDPPVLEYRQVAEIGQDTALLTMKASHARGIKEYIFTVNNIKIRTKEDNATFHNLKPNTQYVATFQAIASNGIATKTVKEIFTTKPIYIESITARETDYLQKGMTTQLRVKTSPEIVSIQELLYTSSNPKVATVSRDGIVHAVSAGTCRIHICAADGGGAETFVTIDVEEGIKCVYVINPQIHLPVNGTSNIICSVYPETASRKELLFSSSNTDVAVVTDTGAVTGVSIGEATIIIQTNNAFENTKYICKVKVEETSVWNEMFSLPQGCRWDYRIPAAIQTNLCYIWNRFAEVFGDESLEPLEDIDFSGGYGTNIREIKIKINALERNIDRVNQIIDWTNPYYVEHKEFHESTPIREDINRWIQFCAVMKSFVDEGKYNLYTLSLAGEILAIRINNELQHLCIIREEK